MLNRSSKEKSNIESKNGKNIFLLGSRKFVNWVQHFKKTTQRSLNLVYKTNLEKQKKEELKKNNVVVQIENIVKSFGDFKALKGINFEIKKGERIGLIGANGAGKTTLSEIIVGINEPTSGSIHYGFDYKKLPQEKIGMQFQDATYPSGLTVKDIITFGLKVYKLPKDFDIKSLLSVFQMEDFYNKKARNLSGGQRQKLNILLSIIHNPNLIVLDEISTGLDISAREEIIGFTNKILKEKGITAIIISHHMGEIEALCDRIIIMDKGEIAIEATKEEIIKKYGSLDKVAKSIIRESLEKQKKVNLEPKIENKNGLKKMIKKTVKSSKEGK